ncbi:uncharacterized protein [Montipora capricornis]|uniref:uncharacterized protein isoform X3 n=1 Tax=Montipora capricornis TaxID=246305 RepID=UPI0035F12D33
MPLSSSLEQELKRFSSNSPMLCPIKFKDRSYPVVGCCFSNASFVMDYHHVADHSVKSVHMKDFFKKGLDSLQSLPVSTNAQEAVQRLKDYLSRPSESLITKLKKVCKTEAHFNCMVATEVFIPLSSGHCIINKKTPDVKDERLRLPSEYGVKGLVIGFSDGYHGEADIVVVPKYEQEQGTVLVSAESEEPETKQPRTAVLVSAESEEPETKQPRTAEGENSPSEDSPGKAIVEGKNVEEGSLNSMSQCVATIIAFARIQCFRHPGISYPFPMLKVDPYGVVVLVYDYPNDVLMISQRVPWSGLAFVIVWLVLHHSLFRPDSLSYLSKYCCGHKTASRGISMDTPWYLESKSVYSQLPKKLFSYEMFDVYSHE